MVTENPATVLNRESQPSSVIIFYRTSAWHKVQRLNRLAEHLYPGLVGFEQMQNGDAPPEREFEAKIRETTKQYPFDIGRSLLQAIVTSSKLTSTRSRPDLPDVAADTTVILNYNVVGKPTEEKAPSLIRAQFENGYRTTLGVSIFRLNGFLISSEVWVTVPIGSGNPNEDTKRVLARMGEGVIKTAGGISTDNLNELGLIRGNLPVVIDTRLYGIDYSKLNTRYTPPASSSRFIHQEFYPRWDEDRAGLTIVLAAIDGFSIPVFTTICQMSLGLTPDEMQSSYLLETRLSYNS